MQRKDNCFDWNMVYKEILTLIALNKITVKLLIEAGGFY